MEIAVRIIDAPCPTVTTPADDSSEFPRVPGPTNPSLQFLTAWEKSREGNVVPIRADLADDIRAWLADKLADARKAALRSGEPVPARLPADTLLFTVPDGLVRILDRALKVAKIPKRDDRGRTLDVHPLRTTFGTL